MLESRDIKSAVSEYSKKRDLYLFSGPIDDESADEFLDLVTPRMDRDVSLFLTTYGGEANAAYRIIRHLQCYRNVRLLIAGRCKSAGALVAVGANSLAYGKWGELGPLDIQMAKPDEILSYRSGLDVLEALAIVTQSGFEAFREYLIEFLGVGLSTKVASEIAATIAARLFEPIAGQVDPMRIAEADRSIKIAMSYGERLGDQNLKSNALHLLVHDYPTHGFVIDKKEAETLFKVVEDLDPLEAAIAEHVQDNRGIIRYPSSTAVALDLVEELVSPSRGKEASDDGDGNKGSDEEVIKGEPGDTAGTEGGGKPEKGGVVQASALTPNGRKD